MLALVRRQVILVDKDLPWQLFLSDGWNVQLNLSRTIDQLCAVRVDVDLLERT
jgi:hypothetical protein